MAQTLTISELEEIARSKSVERIAGLLQRPDQLERVIVYLIISNYIVVITFLGWVAILCILIVAHNLWAFISK